MNSLTSLHALGQMLEANAHCFQAGESRASSIELKSAFQHHARQRRQFAAALQQLLSALAEGTDFQPAESTGVYSWTAADDEAALVEAWEEAEVAAIADYERTLHQRGLSDEAILLIHDQYLQIRTAREQAQALRPSLARPEVAAELVLAPA